MLKTTLYTVMAIGIALEFSSLCILFWMPETLRSTASGSSYEAEHAETISDGDPQREEATTPRKLLQQWLISINKIGILISIYPHIAIAIPAFLTNRLGRQLMAWMLQYVSKRLNWSYALVGSLRTLTSGG